MLRHSFGTSGRAAYDEVNHARAAGISQRFEYQKQYIYRTPFALAYKFHSQPKPYAKKDHLLMASLDVINAAVASLSRRCMCMLVGLTQHRFKSRSLGLDSNGPNSPFPWRFKVREAINPLSDFEAQKPLSWRLKNHLQRSRHLRLPRSLCHQA